MTDPNYERNQMTIEVCQHGRLKRSCDVCILIDDLKDANARIAELEAQLTVKDEMMTTNEKHRAEQPEAAKVDTLIKLTEVLRDALGEQWAKCGTVANAIDVHIQAILKDAKQ